jgi:hypothetical protein
MPDTRVVTLDPDQAITLQVAGEDWPVLVLHAGGGLATVTGIAAHLSAQTHLITPTPHGRRGGVRIPQRTSGGTGRMADRREHPASPTQRARRAPGPDAEPEVRPSDARGSFDAQTGLHLAGWVLFLLLGEVARRSRRRWFLALGEVARRTLGLDPLTGGEVAIGRLVGHLGLPMVEASSLRGDPLGEFR